MYTIPEMSFEEITGRDGNLGLVTLTRVNVLNALNDVMINALSHHLIEWEAASHIKAVVIRAAEGRAFCAGGDIRETWKYQMAEKEKKEKSEKLGDGPRLIDFFRDEYQLNRRIRYYGKPYIALLDGITMGGGAGISMHASHRVATSRLLFAMPETGIGFFPDVGMLHVLARLPDQIGFYLGLTGARIHREDCLALGLVNHAVRAEQFPELIYALADTSLKEEANALVTSVIERFAEPVGSSSLLSNSKEIASCFSEKSVEDIIAALEASENSWSQNVAMELRKKSPLSLKVTLKALRKAVKLDFDESIAMEYGLMQHFLQGHDFFEGIRAVLIDRDHQPNWQPATLAAVKMQDVNQYFVMPAERLTFQSFIMT